MFGSRLSFLDLSDCSNDRAENFRFDAMTTAMPAVRLMVNKASEDLSHGSLPNLDSASKSPPTRAKEQKGMDVAGYENLLGNADFNLLSDSDQQQLASIKLNRRIADLDPLEYHLSYAHS
jgi:hypothetical protein